VFCLSKVPILEAKDWKWELLPGFKNEGNIILFLCIYVTLVKLAIEIEYNS
jgi:hypothetical protein